MFFWVLRFRSFVPDGATTSTQQGTISGSTYVGGTNTATIEGNRTNFNLVGFGGRMAKTEPR
jgi:hypothetical protein